MLLKKENGVTLIALAVTIIVLLIISGITLGTLQNEDSIVKQAKDTGASAGKESIIEKIEADLYQEKAKTGQVPTKAEMKTLIQNKGYNKGTLGNDSFITKDGEYTIKYSEIVGWEDKIEANNYFDYSDIFTHNNNLNNGTKCDEEGWVTMDCNNQSGSTKQFCNYWTNPAKNLKTDTTYRMIIEIKSVSGTGSLHPSSWQSEADTGTKPQFDENPSYSFSGMKARR